MECLEDVRSTLLLSGIADGMPKNLNTETIDADENPHLFKHVYKHSITTHRSNSLVNDKKNMIADAHRAGYRVSNMWREPTSPGYIKSHTIDD